MAAQPQPTTAERLRIGVSRLAVAALMVLIAISTSRWEQVPPVTAVFFLVGCVLVGIATLGRLWCSLYIAGRKTFTLVTEGPYALSRNPLYFFSLLGAAGVGLTTETLTVPALLLGIFAAYYPIVIRKEEARLLELHGERYEAYRKSTPVFFPRRWRGLEPETYAVNPRVYRRNTVSALWFIWLVGFVELVESFHETGLLRPYLHLY